MTYRRTGSTGAYTTNSLASFNGVIYVAGGAHIRPPASRPASVVNGEVTVASPNAIYLDGSVTYASAAGQNVFATNFNPVGILDDSLGIVSSQGVWVTPQSATTIHAAILVTDGNTGFSATYASSSFGTPNLSVYGSISQWRRGIVGYTSGAGFRKRYRYDNRFRTKPPPYFSASFPYIFRDWKMGP